MLHDDLQQRLFAIKAQLSFLKDVNLSADTYRELDEIQASRLPSTSERGPPQIVSNCGLA